MPRLSRLKARTKAAIGRCNHALRVLFEPATPAARGPKMNRPDCVEIGPGVNIQPTASLVIAGGATAKPSKIVLGRGVYLGRYVELGTVPGGELTIDDDTSIQDFCTIAGRVRIGAHCLFSKNILISSSIHRFRDRPTWLIRDQDLLIKENRDSTEWTEPVVIEDDCWIGWGAAFTPGIYVGRGAVIGANSVVTGDVGPYEVHGGAPNRRISHRLDFRPPAQIDAGDDSCLPYFYRGFRLAQAALAESRARGVVEMRGATACLLLAKAKPGQVLRLAGTAAPRDRPGELRLRIDGRDGGAYRIGSGEFDLACEMPRSTDGQKAGDVPAVLRDYTYVELEFAGSPPETPFGVRVAALIDDKRLRAERATGAERLQAL